MAIKLVWFVKYLKYMFGTVNYIIIIWKLQVTMNDNGMNVT